MTSKYNAKEVLKIISNLDLKDRELIKKTILNSNLSEMDISKRISTYHKKYEETYKELV